MNNTCNPGLQARRRQLSCIDTLTDKQYWECGRTDSAMFTFHTGNTQECYEGATYFRY
jgi:hypothetical protein